jgi:excisionase family DNA binding protein
VGEHRSPLVLPTIEDVQAASPDVLPALVTQLAGLIIAAGARLTPRPPVPSAGQANGTERLLTATEVHHRTTLSVAWLYRQAKRGTLPFVRRVGRKVLFSETGLTKWLATRSGSGGA